MTRQIHLGVQARRVAPVAALVGIAVAVACRPTLNETVSLVTGPTVLAVRSDPPEVQASNSVMYTALFVDPEGPVPAAQDAIQWAFCDARKPLAQLGPVNPQCLQAAGDWFVPLGAGLQTSGAVPAAACNEFGPEVPPETEGGTQGRPVDPDATGGYYQPVRFIAPTGATTSSGGLVGIAETRISCGLAGATPNQIAEFGAQYRANVNPTVASLSIVSGDSPGPALVTDEMGQTNLVAAGQRIVLRVAWPACPLMDTCGDGICGPDETLTAASAAASGGGGCAASTAMACPADCAKPTGCNGAERYLDFDLGTRCLVDAREAMSVAWFVTAGNFDNDTTGRASTDTTNSSDNGWQAPGTAPAQPIHLWVVLRDDRGGVAWAGYVLDVK